VVRLNAKNVVAKANRAIEKIAAALPALTGDPTSTLSDILTGHEVLTDERKDDERKTWIQQCRIRRTRTAQGHSNRDGGQ